MTIRQLGISLLLVVSLSSCGQRLSPMEACETSIDNAVRCGTYRIGAFGGTSQDDDVVRCARTVGVFNEECQQIFSDIAQCTTRACDDLEACRVYAARFDELCTGP